MSFCSLSFICRWHTNFCFVSAESNSSFPSLAQFRKMHRRYRRLVEVKFFAVNHSKCEFMLFGSKSQLNKLDIDSISISATIFLCQTHVAILVSYLIPKCLCPIKSPAFAISSLSIAQYWLYPKISHSFCNRETCPLAHSSRLDFGNKSTLQPTKFTYCPTTKATKCSSTHCFSVKRMQSHYPDLKKSPLLPVILERIILKSFFSSIILSTEQPPITIGLCYQQYQPTQTLWSSNSFTNSAFQEILGGTSFCSCRTSPVEFTSTGAEGLKFFDIL